MSDIVGELERVRRAYETPTLSLLHKRRAEVVIAIFRSTFSREARAVPAARFHEQVDSFLAELRMQGIDDVPAGSGRDVAREWVRDQWLVRNPEEDGSESYSLTSHARDALGVVQRLTRERASLSEHRITTILAAVQRLNADINPDRQARVDILEREMEERRAERDRLLAGGDIAAASPDQVVSGFGEILALIGDLPGDFARVQEAFARLRQAVLADFRSESNPVGEVIDAYLQRADQVTTATVEGRAFEGAFALLRDQALLMTLRENITALLAHPVAMDVLLDADRIELRGLVSLVRTGMESVLDQRKKVTTTLREYIVAHDAAADRELDSVLRQIDSEVMAWMRVAGPRSTVPVPLLPEVADIGHLRERLHSFVDEAGPAPLADPASEEAAVVSLEELRAQGGPSFAELRRALNEALLGDAGLGNDQRSPEQVTSLGALFAGLDVRLRRPVEIFGLLQLSTQEPGVDRAGDEEDYVTVRADGSGRTVRVPRFAWTLRLDAAESSAHRAVHEPFSDGRLLAQRVQGRGLTDTEDSRDRPAEERGSESGAA